MIEYFLETMMPDGEKVPMNSSHPCRGTLFTNPTFIDSFSLALLFLLPYPLSRSWPFGITYPSSMCDYRSHGRWPANGTNPIRNGGIRVSLSLSTSTASFLILYYHIWIYLLPQQPLARF